MGGRGRMVWGVPLVNGLGGRNTCHRDPCPATGTSQGVLFYYKIPRWISTAGFFFIFFLSCGMLCELSRVLEQRSTKTFRGRAHPKIAQRHRPSGRPGLAGPEALNRALSGDLNLPSESSVVLREWIRRTDV